MKKIIYLFFIVASLSISACKKKERPTLASPDSKIESIQGSWEIQEVLLIDEVDLLKASRDLKSFYLKGNPSKLSFNVDGTYSVSIGDGKNYFGNGGSWSFDDPNFPTVLILDDGNQWSSFNLLAPVRKIDKELKISLLNKDCNEKAINSIQFNLKRL